jgi:hypothetical protein
VNEYRKLSNVFDEMLMGLDYGCGDLMFLHRWHQQAFLCKV